MLDIKDKSVALIGYGKSNKAVLRYLMKKGIYPVVHSRELCELPQQISASFGDGYLNTWEDVIFRSPSVRPDKIKGTGEVHTEISFALELSKGFKIGITGSDGKTTTSTLIYRMLTKGGENAYLCGNIGAPLIGNAELTRDEDFIVAELSSFQLYDASPSLDVCAITSISQNHLDWHRDMDEYVAAKKNILKNSRLRVLNYDNELLRSFARQGDTCFSLENRSVELCHGVNLIHIVNGVICYNEKELFPLSEIALRGEFNIQNIMCAVGCVYGVVDLQSIRSVAREFCGVDNRMQHVGTACGVEFISSAIDSTPARTEKTLSAFPGERVICILGGYDKNLSYDCLRHALKDVKGVILCGENKDKILASIKRKAVVVNTLKEAVLSAYSMAKAGDFVILSPASASFDMFKNYIEKADCFKEVVRGLENGEN